MSPGSASEEFAGANWITNDLATVISVSDQCEDVSLNLSEPVKIRIYVSQTLGSNVFAKASRD